MLLQVLYEKQCTQLSDIIEIINGDLNPNDRKKLITLCTVDVHARDVVQRLADEKAETAACFQWQSQLRYVFNTRIQDMQVRKCVCLLVNRTRKCLRKAMCMWCQWCCIFDTHATALQRRVLHYTNVMQRITGGVSKQCVVL